MSEQTKIEWCDATLNLWWGCTKVSEGCTNCYALDWSKRHGRAIWGPKGTRVEVKSWRTILNKISKQAKAENRRLRVFCQSMSDTFEGPETMGGKDSDNWLTVSRLREELLKAIIEHPELDFLVLTKRPENVMLWGPTMMCWVREERFPKNLWLGTSVENQEQADKRIPELLKVPAAVRFLSCEPLLGAVSLDCMLNSDGTKGYSNCLTGKGDSKEDGSWWDVTLPGKIHWVICGGESGPKARPMHPGWARSLRAQCKAAGVPFLFKQWGEWSDLPCEAKVATTLAPGTIMYKVGKKAAGRLLDGVEHNEFPEVAL